MKFIFFLQDEKVVSIESVPRMHLIVNGSDDRHLIHIKSKVVFFSRFEICDLPFILLLDAESGEAEVTAYCIGPNKVNLAICANNIS